MADPGKKDRYRVPSGTLRKVQTGVKTGTGRKFRIERSGVSNPKGFDDLARINSKGEPQRRALA